RSSSCWYRAYTWSTSTLPTRWPWPTSSDSSSRRSPNPATAHPQPEVIHPEQVTVVAVHAPHEPTRLCGARNHRQINVTAGDHLQLPQRLLVSQNHRVPVGLVVQPLPVRQVAQVGG